MIVDQSYWDNSYSNYNFSRVSESDPTRQLINRFIPVAKMNQTAFEFGCYQGRYLLEIGKLGYSVNGCDITPRVTKDLAHWLQSNQIATGSIYCSDYKEMTAQKYDLVASFGFVEHFEDYEEVFRLHFDYVKPGGLVIVQFPNFKGLVQYSLHYLLDWDNLSNHVKDAMSLNKYRDIARQYGSIVFCDHYGSFDFWTDDYKKKNGWIRNYILKMILRTRRYWPFVPSHACWSPYAAIIIKTRQ